MSVNHYIIFWTKGIWFKLIRSFDYNDAGHKEMNSSSPLLGSKQSESVSTDKEICLK